MVVFDLHPTDIDEGRKGPVDVGFARRRGRNAADDEIVRRLQLLSDCRSIRVVTSDGDLATRARELGASVLGAGEFGRLLDEELGP
jgi:hypothetical protein